MSRAGTIAAVAAGRLLPVIVLTDDASAAPLAEALVAWKAIGGRARAQEVNRRLARYVDVMIGNEEDFTASLGFEIADTGADLTTLESSQLPGDDRRGHCRVPDFSVVATTLRTVRSATVNDWGAIAWSAPTGYVKATHRPALEIFDRVGRRRQLRLRTSATPSSPARISAKRWNMARPTVRSP